MRKYILHVLIISLTLLLMLIGCTTYEPIPISAIPDWELQSATAQKNPYKDAFFGSFDKDMRKDRIDKAVVSVPTRIIGAPYRALCGLGATVQRTDHTIVYGTDEQKDSGFVIAGRAVLSPFIYLGHMVTGAGKYVKENPVQAVIDAATLIGIGVGISEATDDKRTNSSTGRMKTPIPDPDPGGGAPPME